MDLLPPRMKLQIFVDMPWRIRLKTCLAPLAGKSPQEVMTPAVADPTYLGYAKLYRMMLDLVCITLRRSQCTSQHACYRVHALLAFQRLLQQCRWLQLG